MPATTTLLRSARKTTSQRTATPMPSRRRTPTRHIVEIDIEEDYITQLKRRMDEMGVSQNALARAMGLSPTQVSRWFTNTDRRVTMLVETALHIERALLAIMAERAPEHGAGKKHK